MTRETVLKQIQAKLQAADNETLNDVLLLLSDDYPLDEFDEKLLLDWQAGKHDKTIAEVDNNYYSGKTERLTDGLKRQKLNLTDD